MQLVVDSNVIISALISKDSFVRNLIVLEKVSLFAPFLLIKEIKKYENEILNKSGLSKNDFELIELILLSKIKIFEHEDFEEFISEANSICPDPNDVEFFALCLKMNLPLWSNDKLLKKQNKIKILNTSEIVKIFS